MRFTLTTAYWANYTRTRFTTKTSYIDIFHPEQDGVLPIHDYYLHLSKQLNEMKQGYMQWWKYNKWLMMLQLASWLAYLGCIPIHELHPGSLHWQANHQATWTCSREMPMMTTRVINIADKPWQHHRTNKSGFGWSTGSGLIKPSICTHSGYLYPFPNNPLW